MFPFDDIVVSLIENPFSRRSEINKRRILYGRWMPYNQYLKSVSFFVKEMKKTRHRKTNKTVKIFNKIASVYLTLHPLWFWITKLCHEKILEYFLPKTLKIYNYNFGKCAIPILTFIYLCMLTHSLVILKIFASPHLQDPRAATD